MSQYLVYQAAYKQQNICFPPLFLQIYRGLQFWHGLDNSKHCALQPKLSGNKSRPGRDNFPANP